MEKKKLEIKYFFDFEICVLQNYVFIWKVGDE